MRSRLKTLLVVHSGIGYYAALIHAKDGTAQLLVWINSNIIAPVHSWITIVHMWKTNMQWKPNAITIISDIWNQDSESNNGPAAM